MQEEKKINEGIIEYRISHPYYDGPMGALLPDKMVMKFKDNKYRIDIAKGNMFSTTIISDCNEKVLQSAFSLINDKLGCTLTEEELQTELNSFPSPYYIHSKEIDTIAGVYCNKSVAVFREIFFPEITIWSTDKINIDQPNWCFPFKDIDNVLMAYELNKFGHVFRFEAERIVEKPISDSIFTLSKAYKMVDMKTVNSELSEMIKDLY